MRKHIKMQALILAVVLLVGAVLYGFLYQADNKYTSALPGGYGYNVLPNDLEQVSFLVDGWEYYLGQLLSPSDFEGGIQPEYYTYIGKHANFSDFLGSPYGTATYRLTLEDPGEPTELALYLPELLCAGRIYINGVLVGEQGSLEPYAPRVMDGVYALAVDGSAEIIIQCANYTHYYSGMYYPPAVGTLGTISRMLTLRLVVYGFLCFTALAISLFHLVQWLLGKDKLTRWMGLLSLAFALRVSYPFIRALGIPSVRPLYALEDLCGNLVLLCAVLLAGELSGSREHQYHRYGAVPAAAALCLFTVLFPLLILPYAPVFINLYGNFLFLWKIAAGLYLIFLAGHALSQDWALGRYLLCAAGLYGLPVAASVITANRFEPICGAWLEEYGSYALVLGFSAQMVRRGVLLTRENDLLTQHLQEEVDRKTQGINVLLRERRELLANLLHDLKNPLSALGSYAELVRSGNVSLDSETSEYLNALMDRVEAVGDRFDILQDFSRGERGVHPSEVICLNRYLRDFYHSNLPDMELSGLSFRLHLPIEDILIQGKPDRLRVALENLCYNALFFTPADGTVTLELEQEESQAIITVQDTGIGIAAEDLPHVFERGFTHRIDCSGDGLGLYLVRIIALEHGGSVDATSQVGKGSKFILRLPAL